MKVGIPTETYPKETRVAMVPAQVPALTKAGFEVVVESGAGDAAGFPDAQYTDKGAAIVDRDGAFGADVVFQVRTSAANRATGDADLERYREGSIVIGFCEPLDAGEAVARLAGTGIQLFSMELVPRISRAQHMDALSSQATIAGYVSVMQAASRLPKIFPMLTTAAGTVSPARVLVIGAGVAGLQAIATSKRLGAIIQAYDVRPAAQDDVESVGAKLLQLPLEPGDAEDASGYAKDLGEAFYRRQQEFLASATSSIDVVISTALIPGKPSPLLLTEDAVSGMATGSVIVDLAAARGGNCALTQADEEIVVHGVHILGPTNLPALAPTHASQLYARNLSNFLLAQAQEGAFVPKEDDEIIAETLVARGGQVVHPRLRPAAASSGEEVRA
jgi:NAD(P) transhydrogenase subunit alpha